MAGYPGVSPDAKLLECDGCGRYAREDLITHPLLTGAGSTPVPAYPSIGALPFDPIGSARDMLKEMLPDKAPETRTERLVRSMLDSGWADNHSANALVVYARAIESELDRHCVQHIKGSTPAVALRPRNFGVDFLAPAQIWAGNLGADSRVVNDLLPLVLDTAIAFGALEALTGNESLLDAAVVDRVYWEKVARIWNLGGVPRA